MESFEEVIQEALFLDYFQTEDPRRWSTYVSKRRGVSEITRRRTIARLDSYVSSLKGDIGHAEAELLEFVLSQRTPALLSLVGDVGTGKTSLLAYVFDRLRSRNPRLQHIIPLFIDLRKEALGTVAPTVLDLAAVVARALEWSVDRFRNEQVVRCELDEIRSSLSLSIERTPELRVAQEQVRHAIAGFSDIRHRRLADGRNPIPVIIVDNIDHLSSLATLRILDFFFAVQQHTNCCTILTSRPDTYATDIERTRRREAFVYFQTRLALPDLRQLVDRRIRYAVDYMSRDDRVSSRLSSGNLTMTFSDIEEFLIDLASSLSDSVAQDLLGGLGDYNVRRVLILLERCMRSPLVSPGRIIQSAFFPDETIISQSSHRTQDKLIWALMLSDNGIYIADLHIPNLYSLQAPRRINSYTAFLYLLFVLNWMGGSCIREELQAAFTAYGHSSSRFETVLNRCLDTRLVYSPEWDEGRALPSNLFLSSKGRTFLESIVQSAEYHYHVIEDTPLPGGGPDAYDGSYKQRISLLLRLLLAVVSEEEKVCKHLQQELGMQVASSALLEYGPVSSCLAKAIARILRDGRASRKPGIRQIADSGQSELQEARKRIRSLRQRIRRSIGVDKVVLPEIHSMFEDVSPCGVLSIKVPEYFVQGRVESIALRLEGLDPEYCPERLVALCSTDSAELRPFNPSAVLARKSTRGEYEGEVRFIFEKPTVSLPVLHVRLMADGAVIGSFVVSGR